MLTELEQFEPTIRKLSYAYHIEPLEPSDIAQELRIHLWKKHHLYDPAKGEYKNWAYITCRNRIKNLAKYYKRKKRDQSKTDSLSYLLDKGYDISNGQDNKGNKTEPKIIYSGNGLTSE